MTDTYRLSIGSLLRRLFGARHRCEDVYTQSELIHKVMGTDPATIANLIALQKKIHAIVKKEQDEKRIGELLNQDITQFVAALNEEQRKAFGPSESTLKALIPMYGTAWFRYFILFDPAPARVLT